MRNESGDPVADETRRLRELQRAVDRVEATLRCGGLSEKEQRALIAHARDKCLHLFPDKMDVFELIYEPRFERAIAEARASDPSDRPR
ncbi:MAG: hypothetical protein ACE5O2_14345 [Armatimonadota bacterium]